MIEIQWTFEAIQDREAIFDYIEERNLFAALELDELFLSSISHLACHPRLGREGRVANTRELVVHHNYVVIYDLQGSHVRILRILGATMEWPSSHE